MELLLLRALVPKHVGRHLLEAAALPYLLDLGQAGEPSCSCPVCDLYLHLDQAGEPNIT